MDVIGDKIPRKRKPTTRYGQLIDTPAGEESEEDPFTDNSMDDRDYSPEKSQKVVATSSKRDFQKTKKTIESLELENFDHLLGDSLNSISTVHTNALTEQNDSNIQTNRIHTTENGLEKSDVLIIDDKPNFGNKVDDVCPGAVASLESKIEALFQSIRSMNDKSDEILARVSVLESYLIESGPKISRNDSDYPKPGEDERRQVFLTSLNIPFKRLEDLKKFEDNLSEEPFKRSVVSTYINQNVQLKSSSSKF